MNTTKVLVTGLMALLSLSQADAQILRKKKSKEGLPDNYTDSLKVVKHKPKESYEKMKTKSYSGYYDYYDDRFYWDEKQGRYYTVDKKGERTYYEKRFQPY